VVLPCIGIYFYSCISSF